VIGLGTQDNFAYALDFLEATGMATPTMLWDPSRTTWPAFGVRANSQMIVMSPDLEQGSNLIYGFDQAQQDAVLGFVDSL
jgi:hypothetical protein